MAESKKESTALAPWQEELKKLAVATAEAEKPKGNWMSFQSGQMSLGGEVIKGNKAQIAVVVSVFENQWYKHKFDRDNPQTPHCFAYGDMDDPEAEKTMRPHPESAEPQSETCAECPKNAWRSDPEGGKGKACKNVRRLAFIPVGELTPDKIRKADVIMAKLPVMSVANWSTYASQIANALKLPPLAVITEMSVTPDAKTQFQVNFELVDKIDDPSVIQALLNKRKDIVPLVFAPYDKPTEQAPKQQSTKF